MTEETRARVETQRLEDMRRLASQAERKGVRILVDRSCGVHVATSASDPTRCYVVTVEEGCSCLGAIHGGKCQHHALLLSEMGLLDEFADHPDLTELIWGDSLDDDVDEPVRETVTTSRWVGGARDGFRDVRTVAA